LTYDLGFDAVHYFVYASPFVGVLRLSPDHAEALENVDDVVNTPPLHLQLAGALVEEQEVFLLPPVDAQEPPT